MIKLVTPGAEPRSLSGLKSGFKYLVKVLTITRAMEMNF